MPKVYVLNAPEFEGLIASARAREGYTVRDTGFDYTCIEAKAELVFSRREAGFVPAIWYAALGGGIVGEIVEFGREIVRVVDRADGYSLSA